MEKWHLQVSLRKQGFIMEESCILLPRETISGPSVDLEAKLFQFYVVINNRIVVPMLGRLQQLSTVSSKRLLVPKTDFPVQEPVSDSSISDAVNTSRNASCFEELKRRVEEHRTAFIRCLENVRQFHDNIIAFNETCAESVMEMSLLPSPNITSTPNKNASSDALRLKYDPNSNNDSVVSERQSDLSQSLRESLSVELLHMHRWWKKNIKELQEREKQFLKLEKSFHELLLAKHARYVNLWHALQGVKRDFSAFRSEIFRILRCVDGDIQQSIKRNALIWEKFNMKTVTRTVHKLRRLRSRTIIAAQGSSRNELSLSDSSRNIGADNSRTVALNSTADTEPAIAQHLQDKVEALENGMRQCYIELNAILANLMDVHVGIPVDLENSVFVSTSGCLALLQSVGMAVTQLKLAQKNVEQSLSETLLSLSEVTSSHRLCAVRYSLLEEEKTLLKRQLTKALLGN
uniref:Rootletin-like coiled-coil domain-containing protein n=1 Tax=Trichuris muris TaxID=70415 RepID=A0A5S6QAS1_TRIMR